MTQSLTPHRKAMLAKVHMAKKDLALVDDSYRAVLKRITGKYSARDCTDTQLHKVLEAFKEFGWKPKKKGPTRAGARKLTSGKQAAKARALWLSLYHLGEVRSPQEAALDAFARRITGIDSLAWVQSAEEMNKVIEALKQWCKRIGFEPLRDEDIAVNPANTPKINLLKAQWDILVPETPREDPLYWALEAYCCTVVGEGRRPLAHFTTDQLDTCIEVLGHTIRRKKANKKGKTKQ